MIYLNQKPQFVKFSQNDWLANIDRLSCETFSELSSKEMGFLNPIFPFFSEGEGAV